MNNFIILADTRQQKDSHITKYFDENNILWIRTGLESADYMAIRYSNKIFYKDYTVLIDTKKDVEEMAGNLCKATEHERVKREILKAKQLGCNKFIFLICDKKIKTLEDLKNWSSKKTQVKGETLLKIMLTMKERYGVRFMFTTKDDAGSIIIRLLQK